MKKKILLFIIIFLEINLKASLIDENIDSVIDEKIPEIIQQLPEDLKIFDQFIPLAENSFLYNETGLNIDIVGSICENFLIQETRDAFPDNIEKAFQNIIDLEHESINTDETGEIGVKFTLPLLLTLSMKRSGFIKKKSLFGTKEAFNKVTGAVSSNTNKEFQVGVAILIEFPVLVDIILTSYFSSFIEDTNSDIFPIDPNLLLQDPNLLLQDPNLLLQNPNLLPQDPNNSQEGLGKLKTFSLTSPITTNPIQPKVNLKSQIKVLLATSLHPNQKIRLLSLRSQTTGQVSKKEIKIINSLLYLLEDTLKNDIDINADLEECWKEVLKLQQGCHDSGSNLTSLTNCETPPLSYSWSLSKTMPITDFANYKPSISDFNKISSLTNLDQKDKISTSCTSIFKESFSEYVKKWKEKISAFKENKNDFLKNEYQKSKKSLTQSGQYLIKNIQFK